MKITICGSLAFSEQMGKIAKELENLGHKVLLPASTEKILKGIFDQKEIDSEKGTQAAADRVIKNNAIINHHKRIESSDAILVVNEDKNDVSGYIGGSSFLEIGFAFVLNKKIFLLNDIPEISYTDEIVAMQPIVLDKDLNKII